MSFALAALAACAFAADAQDTISYDATVYITSTITRVNTITASSYPTGAPAINVTSTISAIHPTFAPSYNAGNATALAAPTASAPSASLPGASSPAVSKPAASKAPEFPGAAASLHANAYLAIAAAGLGYLVL
ncbi:uncharacterized protein SETTUDRAFT_38934 [Exserohilum turcica Et28A]|uniref:Uncharacterized protein n=1 Tax=Exserohilum turcicum (strain 28A) TaxID=671987 RepID=R0IUF9_EXST2|nr:uncharacterized protein SETTUDRAFT_38934 [Exserohilum turcica Et28A]EOA88266.1 hypothetical protein SETTUDRAFT_38934 [Exserohilum turcica Et28A]